MSDFNDKVVVITGASSGIGEAAALLFGKSGAKVVVSARREDRGQAVVDSIKADGGEAFFIKTDVTRTSDVIALVDGTLDKYGKIDCAVNNAGITGPTMTAIADIEEADWDELINVNLRAVWVCMKYQIPAMLKQGGGSIVNISSIYGFKPGDLGNAPYVASKHAVIGLSKSAAIDYAQQGIRTNVVSPGFTHSEMVDPYLDAEPDLMEKVISRFSAQNRVGESAEIAEAILWLSSDAASFINGAVLAADGGDYTRLY